MENKIVLLICTALFPLLALAGKPEIVQMSTDTYMIAKTSKAGIFGNPAKMKLGIIKQANEFATSKGKIAVPLASKEVPLAVGQFASFEYQFRLVDKDNSDASGAHLGPVPDVVVDVNGGSQPAPTAAQPDLYGQLLKLDDLRKRGIITNAEYEVQKQKLLSAP
jgi:hypothetical protein